MKIALFSDIHANLPALDSFFKDVELRKPDAIYCLGDLVGYNIWPNEVITEIRKRGICCIAGNYDFGVGRNLDDCGCAYKTEEEKKMGAESIAYTNKLITEEQRQYLRTLPAQIQIEYQLKNEKLFLLLVHGSPRKINEYLFEDRNEKSMQRIIENANADLLFMGHTHKPYHRIFEYQKEGKKAFRHAINLGSVGKPKDNNAKGCYVIVTLNENSNKHDGKSIQVEFIRFDYDLEKAAQAIEKSSLPNAYADMLRKGI